MKNTEKTETTETPKKSKYKSKDNFVPTYEYNDGKSDVVAGESYTIQELFKRHTTGTMPDVGLDPQYDYEDATHDDNTTLRKPDLDLTDIDELKEEVETTTKKLDSEKATKAAKAKATQEAKATAAIIAKHELQKASEAMPKK